MFKENNRFITDWTKTKESVIERYFPNWEDPSWGHYSEIGLAGAIANFSVLIADKGLSARAFELSKLMAETAGKKLIADWDEGDICPPYRPHHWPWGKIIWPDPAPWQEISGAEQIGIAYLLTKFSALTPSATYNKELKSLATEIVAGITGKLHEEFEKCGTLPRPLPKHPQAPYSPDCSWLLQRIHYLQNIEADEIRAWENNGSPGNMPASIAQLRTEIAYYVKEYRQGGCLFPLPGEAGVLPQISGGQ